MTTETNEKRQFFEQFALYGVSSMVLSVVTVQFIDEAERLLVNIRKTTAVREIFQAIEEII